MVQWIRIQLPMQRTQVRSLVWGHPSCCRAAKPMGHNYWAQVPQLLKPACSRAGALKQEKPPQWEGRTLQLESCPHSPDLEKSPCKTTKTQHSQKYINKIKFKKATVRCMSFSGLRKQSSGDFFCFVFTSYRFVSLSLFYIYYTKLLWEQGKIFFFLL